MNPIDGADVDDLERLIDRHGLAAMLEALEQICRAKEDHIRTNWQDAVTARPWRQAANVLETTAHRIHKLFPS